MIGVVQIAPLNATQVLGQLGLAEVEAGHQAHALDVVKRQD